MLSTLLKAMESKYNYVALLTSGHIVSFEEAQPVGNAIRLVGVELPLQNLKLKFLDMNETDLIAVGETEYKLAVLKKTGGDK